MSEFDDFGDLDKLFGSDSGLEQEKKKNKPVTELGRGFLSGIREIAQNTATDTDFYKSTLKESGLKEYGDMIGAAAKTAKEVSSLYNESVRVLKDPVAELVRNMDKRIPASQTFLKKLSERAKHALGIEDAPDTSYKSEEQIQEENVQNTVNSTFSEQDQITAQIAENARFKTTVEQRGLGNRILQSINNGIYGLNAFNSKIAINFQKKSLEIQVRSYLTHRETLALHQRALATIIDQNKALIWNSSLPDIQKIRISKEQHESQHKMSKFALTKGASIIGNSAIGKRIKDAARAKLIEHLQNVRSGIEGANAGMGMSDMMDMAGMSTTKLIGMGAASFLLDNGIFSVQDLAKGIFSKFIKKRINPDGSVAKFGKKYGKYAIDHEGGISRGIKKGADWLRPSIDERLNGGFKTSIRSALADILDNASVGKVDLNLAKKDNARSLHQAAVYNLGTQKSITTIIPGYLARILREVQTIRTGKTAELTVFDHDRNQFLSSSRHTSMVSSTIKKSMSGKWTNAELDKIVGSTFGADISPAAAAEIKKMIVRGSLRREMIDGEYLSSEKAQRNVPTELRGEINGAIHSKLTGNDEATNSFVSNISKVKSQIGDPRGYIEDLINAGYHDQLIQGRIIRHDGQGSYRINEKKLTDFLTGTNKGRRFTPKRTPPTGPTATMRTVANARKAQAIVGPTTPLSYAQHDPITSVASAAYEVSTPAEIERDHRSAVREARQRVIGKKAKQLASEYKAAAESHGLKIPAGFSFSNAGIERLVSAAKAKGVDLHAAVSKRLSNVGQVIQANPTVKSVAPTAKQKADAIRWTYGRFSNEYRDHLAMHGTGNAGPTAKQKADAIRWTYGKNSKEYLAHVATMTQNGSVLANKAEGARTGADTARDYIGHIAASAQDAAGNIKTSINTNADRAKARYAKWSANRQQKPVAQDDTAHATLIKSKDPLDVIVGLLQEHNKDFKEYADSIIDVHVVSNLEYKELERKSKHVRRRQTWLGKLKDVVTPPFKAAKIAVHDGWDAIKNSPKKALEALKSFLPTNILLKFLELPFNFATSIFKGMGFIKDKVTWAAKKLHIPGAMKKLIKGAGKLLFNTPLFKNCKQEDIYILNSSGKGIQPNPILTKIGFSRAEYFTEEGKPCKGICDIKGDIYDRDRNLLLSATELKNGIYDKNGKRIIHRSMLNKIVGFGPRVAMNTARRFKDQLIWTAKMAGKAALAAPKALYHVAKFGSSVTKGLAKGAIATIKGMGAVAGRGVNALGHVLSPFHFTAAAETATYSKKSYNVLVEILKAIKGIKRVPTAKGGIWKHHVPDVVSGVEGGLTSEVSDPNAQIYAGKWWRHPKKAIAAKYAGYKSTGGIKALLAKILKKEKSSSGGGILSDLEHAGEFLGGGFLLKKMKGLLGIGEKESLHGGLLKKIGSMFASGFGKLGKMLGGVLGSAKNAILGKGKSILNAGKDLIKSKFGKIADTAGADAAEAGGAEAGEAGAVATGAALPAAGVALAGGAGYLAGKYVFNPLLNKTVKAVTGGKDKSLGGLIYKLTHKVSSPHLRNPAITAHFAAMDKSTNAPLGIKQNNPGYLKTWGKLKIKNGIAHFPTPEGGIVALGVACRIYANQGYNTIITLMKKLSLPGYWKDPKNFISTISEQAHLKPGEVLDLTNVVTLDKLLTAIIIVENGKMYYSPEMIQNAVRGVADIGKPIFPMGTAIPKLVKPVTSSKSLIHKPKKKPVKTVSVISAAESYAKSAASWIGSESKSIYHSVSSAATRAYAGASAAAIKAYKGVKYVAGEAKHYAIEGFKAAKGAFARVVQLVGIYGISGLTAYLESRGDAGAVSSGAGDHGGVSYGTFQLSSATSGVQGFLGYISNTKEGKMLMKAGAVDSEPFKSMWRKLGKTDKHFAELQAQYNIVNYFDPIMKRLSAAGLDFSSYGLGVKAVLDRTSNQFGDAGGASIVTAALHGKDITKMSEADVITTIENHKLHNIGTFFRSSSAAIQAGVAREIEMEKAFALKLNKGTLKDKSKKSPIDSKKAGPSPKGVVPVKKTGKTATKPPVAGGKKPALHVVGGTATPGKPGATAASPPHQAHAAITAGAGKKAPLKLVKTATVDNKTLVTPKASITPVGFTGPHVVTPRAHPIPVVSANHEDIKQIHGHVKSIRTTLEKSLDVQNKTYEALVSLLKKNGAAGTAGASNTTADNTDSNRPAPRNTPVVRSRPTPVPATAVTIKRKTL